MSSKTNLVISSKCIQCGSCIGLGTNWLEEANDGSICVKNGVFVETDNAKVKELISICPINAISVDMSVKKESSYAAIQRIINELENFVGVAHPKRNDFKFNVDDYNFNIPYPSGEGHYDYSSESAAERAAENEFNRVMYSKIDQIILQIVSSYRVKKMTPYYSKETEKGSVYAASNARVIKLLKEAQDILLGESITELPSDFTSFNVFPDNDITWKMLNKGELMSDEMISSIRSEFNSCSYTSLSSYDSYYDIDDMDRYDGTGTFGKMKFKTKYCYRNVYDACKELANDIKSACRYQDDNLEDRALRLATDLVDIYNKEVDRILNQKIAVLKKVSEQLTKTSPVIEKIAKKVYPDEPVFITLYTDPAKNPKEDIFLTECEVGQYFFSNGQIYRVYEVNDNVQKRKIVMKNKQFQYSNIVAYHGIITFDIYGDFDQDNFFTYDVVRDKCTALSSRVFNIYYGCGKIVYVHWSLNNRFGCKQIYSCNIDGSDRKCLMSFNSGSGIVRVENISDGKVYYTEQGGKSIDRSGSITI